MVGQLYQLLHQQANMLGMDDAFLFSMALTLVAVVMVLLIPMRPQPKGRQDQWSWNRTILLNNDFFYHPLRNQ